MVRASTRHDDLGLTVYWWTATSICSGKTTPWDKEPLNQSDMEFSDSDDDFPLQLGGETELSQILSNVAEVVDCLFRLSVSIRNPAPHDRFKRTNWVEKAHFEQFDIAHVREAIPSVPTAHAERLGKAITRRRQYFSYRQSHHNKLAHGLEGADAGEDAAAASTVASSIPQHLRTTNSGPRGQAVIDEDNASETGWTETTAGSALEQGKRAKIPPLPKEGYERPFECPFCYTMISATTTRAWTYVGTNSSFPVGATNTRRNAGNMS